MNQILSLLVVTTLSVLLLGHSADAEDACGLAVVYILGHKDELEFERFGGVDDEGIVVVARETDEDWFSTIRAGWKADRKRGRWVTVDPTSVRCWS